MHRRTLLKRSFRDIGLAAVHGVPVLESLPDPITVTTELGFRSP